MEGYQRPVAIGNAGYSMLVSNVGSFALQLQSWACSVTTLVIYLGCTSHTMSVVPDRVYRECQKKCKKSQNNVMSEKSVRKKMSVSYKCQYVMSEKNVMSEKKCKVRRDVRNEKLS